MSNNIVVVNVSQTQAPAPSNLQKSGAFVTQGGTTTDAGTLTLLTSLADLTDILAESVAITSMTWASGGGGVVTVTTAAPHGWTTADVIPVVVAGATPVGYNGAHTGTITGASTLTFPLTSDPGAETVPGTVILGAVSELLAMGTTFFAQAADRSVYVLELGEDEVDGGVADLATWIGDNPKVVYSWLIPKEWDNNSDFVTMLGNYTAPNALTYFFVTTVYANRAVYDGLKCVLAVVNSPGTPTTQFPLAAEFSVTLGYSPSSVGRITPLSYAYVFGVTPYPIPGNGTVFTNLNAANVGWFGTGAEGGISNVIVFYGQMQDGNPFGYWYAADWAQINIELALANEVINGSNNPLAPLYFDQPGINRLQNRALQTMAQAVTNGLALGTVKGTQLSAQAFTNAFLAGTFEGQLVVNAEPFVIYNNENPSDYAIGRYAGLACVFTPLRGFKQIIFYLNVTNIVA